jgi:hypothetical protein
MDLGEIGYEDGHCVCVAQDRVQCQVVVKTVMNLIVP